MISPHKYFRFCVFEIIIFLLIYCRAITPQISVRSNLTDNKTTNRSDRLTPLENLNLANNPAYNNLRLTPMVNPFSVKRTYNLQEQQLTDSLDLNYIPWDANEHFWLAAPELAFVEFIPWAKEKWTSKDEDPGGNWANVSAKSWWYNIRSGWVYDGDAFQTNYFAHPYHGNLYFNVGRTNGYSFWGSSLWAFTGSLLWEFFGETTRPAINDWINTSLNGSNLGEMLYRISSMITDNTATGTGRVFREIAGALINPVRGLNRLVTGETAKVFPNSEESNPKGFLINFDAGARQLEKSTASNEKQEINEGIISTDINYGNLYYSNIKTPFSWFGVSAALSGQGPVLTNLQSFGNLFGWHLKKDDDSRYTALVTLNYNYFNNPDFIYGGTSVNPHLISYYKIGNKTNIITNLDLELIAMGATPTDYYVDVEGRNYDFGQGIGLNLGSSFNDGAWSIVNLFYSSRFIWTQSEPSGSKHHLQMIWLNLSYPILNKLGIGIGLGYYWRNSYYNDKPDIFKSNRVIRLVLKTSFF